MNNNYENPNSNGTSNENSNDLSNSVQQNSLNNNSGMPPKNESTPKNNSYGYRWNCNDYKEEENKGTKNSKKNGFKILAISIASIFVLSFAVLTTSVTINMFRNTADSGKTQLPATNTEKHSSTVGSVNGKDTTTTANFPSSSDLAAGATLTIPQISEKCLPGAVGIVVEVESSYGYGFGSYTSTGVGSGFILNKDGYIVTNHHVIANAKTIKVVLYDETELEATLVGSDSLSDLAVLKVEHDNLTPLEIGNSDELVVGELAVAIGSPAGIEFYGTVTDGIISAIKRNVEITDNYGRVQKTMTLIQTNATINKGNSGGPLINSKGQVIGINTLKLTNDYEGIGFSIPINGAMSVIQQLINDGKVSDRGDTDFVSGGASIGITEYADIAADEAEYYGIPQGVYVIQIKRDSTAAQAGLRRGDIITKYNGEDVKTAAEINSKKSKNKVGDEVVLTIYRDQEGEKEITFKLDSNES